MRLGRCRPLDSRLLMNSQKKQVSGFIEDVVCKLKVTAESDVIDVALKYALYRI